MRTRHLIASACSLLGLALLVTGCPSAASAPPAPTMPAGWNVKSDVDIKPAQIKPVESKLGAKLSALRNTVYEVKGKQVQLNILVAADAGNADKLMKKLKDMKSEEALFRKGFVIYEFVGDDSVMADMKKGRKHLEDTL